MALNAIPDTSQIIVMEETSSPGAGQLAYRVAYWLTVPLARVAYYASPTKTSQVKGASGTAISNIQGGQILEVVETGTFDAGTPLATIEARLQTRFSVLQTDFNNTNPWNHYGSNFNGAVWAVQTVA